MYNVGAVQGMPGAGVVAQPGGLASKVGTVGMANHSDTRDRQRGINLTEQAGHLPLSYSTHSRLKETQATAKAGVPRGQSTSPSPLPLLTNHRTFRFCSVASALTSDRSATSFFRRYSSVRRGPRGAGNACPGRSEVKILTKCKVPQ